MKTSQENNLWALRKDYLGSVRIYWTCRWNTCCTRHLCWIDILRQAHKIVRKMKYLSKLNRKLQGALILELTLKTNKSCWKMKVEFGENPHILLPFPEKVFHTLAGGYYGAESKYAGKHWSWRIQRWVRLRNPTAWSRSSHVWNLYGAAAKMKWNFDLLGAPAISNVTRAAPSNWISKSESPLDAPGSVLSSVIWIGAVRHRCALVATFSRKNKRKYRIWSKLCPQGRRRTTHKL